MGHMRAMTAATTLRSAQALAHAGLIAAEQHGRSITYRADFEAMQGLVDYLTENCCAGAADCGPAAACTPKKKGARA